jgi:hypothetical protein
MNEPKGEETIFAEALHLPPDERVTYLTQSMHGAAELRRRVESLLGSYGAGDFLEQAAATRLRQTLHVTVPLTEKVLRAPMQEESPDRLAELNRAAAGEKVTIYMGAFGSDGTLVKPIKSFVAARGKSVSDQLTGKSQGQTIDSGF